MRAFAERVFYGSLAALSLGALSTIGAAHGLAGPRWNPSASIPRGLYLYVPGRVARGEFVQVCLPPRLASYARSHAIALSGPCPNDVEPLVKVLAALPGDVVTVSPDAVRVNGRPWPSSAIRSFDSRSHRVDLRMPYGTQRLGADRVLLLGLNPRSWDGRYFGPLPSSAVTGRWFPLITDQRIST